MTRLLRRLAGWLSPELRRDFGPDLDATLAEAWRREAEGRPLARRAYVSAALIADLLRQILAGRWSESRLAGRIRTLPRGSQPMHDLVIDLRFALRSLRRAPLASSVVLLTLALGIGGATTVFTLVNAELLAPLPYRESERLLVVHGTEGSTGGAPRNLSAPNVETIRNRARSLESITGFDDRKTFNLTGGERPVRVFGASVDGAFFDTLGIAPLSGRLLGPADDRPEAPRVAVLGEGLWRRQFGGDAELVGDEIRLNELSYTVVGIAPASLRIPNEEQIWVPLASHPYGDDRTQYRGSTILESIARLAPGVDVAAARAELRDLGATLAAEFPDANEHLGLGARPLREVLVGQNRTLLMLLMGAVSSVLLLACVNVATLLVSRAAERQDELGLRLALGAGRGRVGRQLVTESLLTAALAGTGGVLAAVWSRRAILAAVPDWFPRLEHVGLDGRVLAFAAALTLGTGLLFGILPAFLISGRNPLSSGRGAGRRGARVRRGLVVVEVALALALLISAGLMSRSLVHLAGTDNGFLTEEVLTATISLPERRYQGGAALEFVQQLLGRVQPLPGVAAATAANRLPVSGGTNLVEFGIPDRGPDYEAAAHLRLVTPSYFDTLGVELVAGRVFTVAEFENREPVVLIDVELAERHWPDGDALGSSVRPVGIDADFRIVGIAERTRHWGPQYGPEPVLYGPFSIAPTSTVSFALRVEGPPTALVPQLRDLVRQLDPELPVEQVRDLASAVSSQTARPRTGGIVLLIFSTYALGMAVLGVYGVLGHTVGQRTREIGIRMALGARTAGIRALVVRDGALVLGVGIAVGLGAGVLGARGLGSQLHGVDPLDPTTFLAAAGLLVATGLVAVIVPARRASRIDPVDCLRAE